MTLLLAVVVGVLFGCGVYLLLQRSLGQILVGLVLLGNAVNLSVFVAGRLTRAAPPLAGMGQSAPPPGAADPLPQALVLTAIVIGFALLAFAAALLWRTHEAVGDDDPDSLRRTDT
jgi:multicomponent Na+:H+ antiporter subunit C